MATIAVERSTTSTRTYCASAEAATNGYSFSSANCPAIETECGPATTNSEAAPATTPGDITTPGSQYSATSGHARGTVATAAEAEAAEDTASTAAATAAAATAATAAAD